MFVGMFLCIVMDRMIAWLPCLRKTNMQGGESQYLIQNAPAPHKNNQMCWKLFFLTLIPACCDLTATTIGGVGLLYIEASVWQMLRGSMMIFSAGLSVIFLKKRLKKVQWIALATCTGALCIVGYANMAIAGQKTHKSIQNVTRNLTSMVHQSTSDEDRASVDLQMMGIGLVLLSQIIQAGQVVVEESLLSSFANVSPLQITSSEGFWGTLLCGSLLAILTVTPPSHVPIGHLFHEDAIDTYTMIKNSEELQFVLGLYIICILFFNACSILVIKELSAIVRTILTSVRALCIWGVELFMFHILHYQGEAWSGKYSLIQLFGFALLVLGTLWYNEIVDNYVYCFQGKCNNTIISSCDGQSFIFPGHDYVIDLNR